MVSFSILFMQQCCIYIYFWKIKLITMNMNFRLIATVFAFATIIGCTEDEPETPIIPNEEELITTLKWQLISINQQDTLNFLFRDLDGDGGSEPTMETIDLKANTIYSARVTLLNELNMPVEDITEEVSEEAEDHQFFYETDISGLTVAYSDNDVNGNPIGILSMVTTADSSSGSLNITLLHLPDKFANGVSTGDISLAGGESDISVSFNFNVKL